MAGSTVRGMDAISRSGHVLDSKAGKGAKYAWKVMTREGHAFEEEGRERSTARGRTTVMSIVRHAFENQEHG